MKVGAQVKKFFQKNPIVATIVGVTVAWATGGISFLATGVEITIGGAVTAGAVSGALTGGIKGAVTGGISGAVTSWIGGLDLGLNDFNFLGQAALHGVAQGTLAESQGGNFGAAFLSASFASIAGSMLKQAIPGRTIDAVAAKTVASAIVGGTASVIGGGRFQNGAATGAFIYLFNHGFHEAIEFDYGWHNNNTYSAGCFRISSGCTEEAMYKSLLHGPAPGVELDQPVQDGQVVPVRVLFGTHLGDVKVVRYDSLKAIMNISQENHLLYDGVVYRQVESGFFTVGIRSIGWGYGYQSSLNQAMALPLWFLQTNYAFEQQLRRQRP